MEIIKTEEFESESLSMDIINHGNEGNIGKYINNNKCIESILNVINVNKGVDFVYFSFLQNYNLSLIMFVNAI